MKENIEIERKFLVLNDSYKEKAFGHGRIQQGYLCSGGGKAVRVRIRDDHAYLTIKGPTPEGGLNCLEIEKEITLEEGKLLMGICEPGIIDKERWLVDYKGYTFEVDEFFGENEGLVMAEVELSSENEEVELPDFIGTEVTGNPRFYNSHLRMHPYKEWK
jgi:CYTH domain-containing protein